MSSNHTNYLKNPGRKLFFLPFYGGEQICTRPRLSEPLAQLGSGRRGIKPKGSLSGSLPEMRGRCEEDLGKRPHGFLITMALLECPPPWNSMVPKASVGLSCVCLLMDHFSDWMSFRERRLSFFSFWRTEILGVRPTCWPIRRPQQHLQQKRSRWIPCLCHDWSTHFGRPAGDMDRPSPASQLSGHSGRIPWCGCMRQIVNSGFTCHSNFLFGTFSFPLAGEANMPPGFLHPPLSDLPYCSGSEPGNKSPTGFSTFHSSRRSNLAWKPLRGFEGRNLTCTFK